MALPPPVELPYPAPFNQKTFDPNFVQNVTATGGGFILTSERVPPLWRATFQTPPLTPDRDNIFQAFLDTLAGSMIPFLAYDLRKPKPFAYRTHVGLTDEPWIAAGQTAVRVTAASYTNSTLSLDRLAVGAILTRGDYIAYQRGNAWYLHRIYGGDYTANGSGIATPVVIPRPLDSSTTVNARLTRACCAMKVIGQVNKTDKVEDTGPSYSFNAVQFIDRS
jgi:hypothetical protein